MKAISWLLFSLFVSSIVLSFSLYPQDDTPHFLKKWLQTAYLEDPQLSKEKLTQHLISLQQQLQATPTLRGFRFFSPTGELLYQYPETLYPLDPFPKNSFDSLSFFRDSWTLQRPSSTFTCIAEWVLSPAPLLPYAWICCLLLSAISGVLACFLFLPLPPPNHSPTQTPLVLEKSMEFRPGIAEELEKSNQFLTDLIGKIKDSLKDIRDFQFTSNAAHELRTPLTTIRGELELLQLRPQDFTPQRLTPVMEEIDRLNKLCNSLLLLTRLDEEKENVHKNKVSLHYILSHVFEQMWPLADENQIQLTYDSDGDAEMVADEDLLIHVFLNLIDNAIKYTPAGGSIRIHLEVHETATRITIQDSGSGFDPQHIPHIFQRFYRIPNQDKKTPGTGLGLAIVKKIVEVHDGSIQVYSEPGKGALFEITFPRKQNVLREKHEKN